MTRNRKVTFEDLARHIELICPDAIMQFDEDGQIVIQTRACLDSDDSVVNMAD